MVFKLKSAGQMEAASKDLKAETARLGARVLRDAHDEPPLSLREMTGEGKASQQRG